MTMILAATADIHSPVYYDLFQKSLDRVKTEIDLFLIAGDLIDRSSTREIGPLNELRKVSNAFFGKFSCPVLGCFGNNEFEQDWDEIRKQNPEIRFLQDESATFDIKGKKVGVVGSKGSLDRPTWWQRSNMPSIYETYQKRIDTIDRLLADLDVDYKILLIHYPPTYQILSGENPSGYPELASNALEGVIKDNKVDLVLTGHAHKGKKEVWVDGVPVLNVGLALNNGIVIIHTDKLKPGLGKFF